MENKAFQPGDLVMVKPLSRYAPHSQDPRVIGGIGTIVSVTEESGRLFWYNVFIMGQVVDNIIDIRVSKLVT